MILNNKYKKISKQLKELAANKTIKGVNYGRV